MVKHFTGVPVLGVFEDLEGLWSFLMLNMIFSSGHAHVKPVHQAHV